jgi:hypothetical protein
MYCYIGLLKQGAIPFLGSGVTFYTHTHTHTHTHQMVQLGWK